MRAEDVSTPRLRFGAFEFEPASGELYRDGTAIRLQEQPRQVPRSGVGTAGRFATSVRWLRQAVDTGFPCSPWFSRDTLLDPVRADPAFRELISGMLTRGASDSRR